MLPPEQHSFTDDLLQEAAQFCANAYTKVFNERFNCELPYPARLTFDLQLEAPKFVGRARSSNWTVELNMPLLRGYPTKMLNDVIPHELAHLVQMEKFDTRGKKTQPHGAEWQLIMRTVGLVAEIKEGDMDFSLSIAEYKANKKLLRALERAAAANKE